MEPVDSANGSKDEAMDIPGTYMRGYSLEGIVSIKSWVVETILSHGALLIGELIAGCHSVFKVTIAMALAGDPTKLCVLQARRNDGICNVAALQSTHQFKKNAINHKDS